MQQVALPRFLARADGPEYRIHSQDGPVVLQDEYIQGKVQQTVFIYLMLSRWRTWSFNKNTDD
jgi:hypothetical protein